MAAITVDFISSDFSRLTTLGFETAHLPVDCLRHWSRIVVTAFDIQQHLLTLFDTIYFQSTAVFLNRRAAARYRVLASIIPGREKCSWKLSF